MNKPNVKNLNRKRKMKIEQIRTANVHKPGTFRAYCIGHVYIDGAFFCDTIEDYDRGLTDGMTVGEIKDVKVAGKTAIPTGTYNLLRNVYSPRFGQNEYYKELCNGCLPRLDNVKGFAGVLVHPGNDENSTEGCVIVGQNKVVGKVINSRRTFEELIERLRMVSRDETITWTITRTYSV